MSVLHHSNVSLLSSPGAWLSVEEISALGHAFHMHHHCKLLTKSKSHLMLHTNIFTAGWGTKSFSSDMSNMKMIKNVKKNPSIQKNIFPRKGSRRNSFKNLPSCTKLFNNFFEAPIPRGWHCAITTLQLAYAPCNQHWYQLQHKDVSWCASQLAWHRGKELN